VPQMKPGSKIMPSGGCPRARRLPRWTPPGVRWVAADVERQDLRPLLSGADAVIHLAWLIQPSRDEDELERVNVIEG
jgi:UDP-glucose 4-epimerase